MNIYLEIILRVLGIIILSIGSAILYRLGGASSQDQDAEFPWIPRWFKNLPKKRDAGCGVLKLLSVYLMIGDAPFLAYFFAWGLLWASLSTYWDELFGYDNHYMHGFMCQFSMLPIVFFSGYWVVWVVQCLMLTLAMGIYSGYEGNAYKEEMGRGWCLTIVELLKF